MMELMKVGVGVYIMIIGGDVLGSSLIFSGFLAPHGLNISIPLFHVLGPIITIDESPLDHDCLCRELLECLTRFGNLYVYINCVVEMREFFLLPYE